MLLKFSIQIAKCLVVKNIFNVNTHGLEKLILSLNIKKSATFYFKLDQAHKTFRWTLNLTCLLRTPLPSVSAKSQIWNVTGKKNQSLYILTKIFKR